jgi:mannose-6-phosphate isomerase-like protein (cupin superfamily)
MIDNFMTYPKEKQTTVHSVRPWGDIFMVVRNQKCSVDLTEVKPGERASLHSHRIRHELFHFLDDGAVLEIEGELFHPKAHEEFMINPGQKHRFWAEDRIFRMLVVSFGEWKAEDQIRHEDDYGREGETLKF